MEKFTQLHCHSVFSIYDGLSSVSGIIDKAVEKGHEAVALTDHGSMSGLLKFQQAALKKGIKPILGSEFYIVNGISGDDKIRKNNHIILLAENETGYKNMCYLNNISNEEDHFYYKPRITFDELFQNKEGIFVSSACLASGFANLIKKGKEKEAEELFDRFCKEFGENFSAELQLNETNFPELTQKDYNAWLINIANKKGVPLIITGDCHYLNPTDAEVQELMFRIKSKEDSASGEQRFACHTLYYHGIDDYKKFNKAFGYNYSDEFIESCCANAYDIGKKCNYIIPERTKMLLPRQAFDEDQKLVEEAKKGLERKFKCSYKDCPKEYRDRLEEEIRIMIKKGMARYLLCLQDIVNYCKNNDIDLGVGRGSAAGSLVCSCLGIVHESIDALKANLIFSRFVSEERLPTIVIDYSKSGNRLGEKWTKQHQKEKL